MYRFFLFFLLFPAMFFAQHAEEQILESPYTPLTALYGVPETNIFGVNVINGDYNYSSLDFKVPGADPLVFQRIYSSSNHSFKAFCTGWNHNFYGKADTYASNKHFHVIVSKNLGAVPFKKSGKVSKRHDDYKLNKNILKKGVTNCGGGGISGRNNLKNMEVKYYTDDGVGIENPDGTKDYYKVISSGFQWSENRLFKTKKPNGLTTFYENYYGFLTSVYSKAADSRTSNEIVFKIPAEGQFNLISKEKRKFQFDASSTDGKTGKYFFDWYEARSKSKKKVFDILMSKFKSNCLPEEDYSYKDSGYDPQKLVNIQGQHHRINIDYYEKGDLMSLNGYSKEVYPSHIAEKRVKKIDVAVGNSEDLQTVFRFAYDKDKYTKMPFTEVYNQHNHLLKFIYSSSNYRLSSIERYKGTSDYSLYSRERLYFGANKQEGDLLLKTVEEADKTIHYAENYRYDGRGNVLIRDLHFRTLTGLEAHPISVKWSRAIGGEVKSCRYTYNNLNLPITENDGRLNTKIAYETRDGKGTNLLKSKIFKEGEVNRKREFYEYDDNAGCILKIEDDGSGISQDDLKGIHCRKITRFTNREESFAGLPLEIDQWGSNGSEEKRISRTTLKYDSHAYVEEENYFDANNVFAYKVQKIRDIQGNIITETDALGQTTHRKYNLYHSLLQAQGPSSDYSMEYTYDWLQRPIIETRRCIDGIDLSVLKSYDLEGRLTKIQDPYGFTTEYRYNEQGLPVEIVHPVIRSGHGEWVRPCEFKEYNFMGHLISEIDPNGAVTLYVPNDVGSPLKITYPDGTVEKFRYSIYGEVTEKTLRNGSKVLYSYDAFSRPISEKTYDQSGILLKETSKTYSGLLLLSEKDGEGLITEYKYDYAGRVSEIIQGNNLTKYFYDALGRIQEERRYFGEGPEDYVATIKTYDLLSRVICCQELDAQGNLHFKEETAYDAENHIISTTTWNHSGAATSYNTYDPRGNLSSCTDALGNTTYFDHRYDFFFEGVNLPCVEKTDPKGVKTITVSDSKGAVISEKVYSPFGELLSNTENFYDASGNLIRKEQHLPNEIILLLYDYDSSSRLIRQINGAGTSEQISTNFIYNEFGELAETEYADGTSKFHSYDGLGRLSEEWASDLSIHYRYTYNRQDLLLVAENCINQKKTIKEYSLEGNLLSEQFENGLKIGYLYDRMNRVTECIYPDGSSVKQTYNPVFLSKTERIKNGTVVYEAQFSEFDLSGRAKKIQFPKKSGILSLELDALSRPTQLHYPHYTEKEICYDNRGLLISKIVNDNPQLFDHDDLQQLTLEKTQQYSHAYENDSLYRQISVDGLPQTHNAVHQLTEGVHGEYQFDPKGRRIEDSGINFTYDAFDRLIEVSKEEAVWKYTYDAFNRKMSKVFADQTIYYLYDGHEEIGSYDADQKNLDLKVLSATEGSIPIAIELEEQHYAPLISSQGHIVGLVEVDTGNLKDESFLTLFGEDLAENPISPWRFCGKRHEESALGIIDFGCRFYHPKSAQWLTRDPIGESDGPNLYAYVSNNPACCIDRFGLFMDDFQFSNCWSSFKDNCCWAGNQVADFTYRNDAFCNRALGGMRFIGGMSEMLAGINIGLAGSAATGGLGAPLALAAGNFIIFHGCDEALAG